MTTAYHPWGRVDADGTVYVRTADGERVIGSWQAGSPDEAIAFFQRKYEALETEVVLLEQRIAATDMAPAQASASVQRLVRSISEANALGDLDGLRARLERLTEDVGHRREEAKAAREQARVAAREIKERIVAEAEQIAAEATHWKSSGERMRELLEEWKAAPHAERAAEAALWKRLSAARNAFTKRRKAYFATLEAEREDVRARKENLVADAEALSGSTDWGATTSAYRELMRQWKAAGRADRDTEAELWKRFRGAQDKFFTARSEVFSAKDAELREHAEAKQETARRGTEPAAGVRCPGRQVGAAPPPGAMGADRGGPAETPASTWSPGCGGSRTRSARRRKPSGAGRTPRRWRGPRAPWRSCARPSPSWRRRWPRRATRETPEPSTPPRKP